MIALLINNDLHDLSLRHLYFVHKLKHFRFYSNEKDRRNINLHSQISSIS